MGLCPTGWRRTFEEINILRWALSMSGTTWDEVDSCRTGGWAMARLWSNANEDAFEREEEERKREEERDRPQGWTRRLFVRRSVCLSAALCALLVSSPQRVFGCGNLLTVWATEYSACLNAH